MCLKNETMATVHHKHSHHAEIFPKVEATSLFKNMGSHIDASHSRQPLVKGEKLVRYEVNAEILVYRQGCNMLYYKFTLQPFFDAPFS